MMKRLLSIAFRFENSKKFLKFQYLKEQRIGMATFIPLDKIKVKPVPEKLRLLGDKVKPIIDVMTVTLPLLFRDMTSLIIALSREFYTALDPL